VVALDAACIHSINTNYRVFDFVLDMNHEGMLRLRQNLTWPPKRPLPPIYIIPWN